MRPNFSKINVACPECNAPSQVERTLLDAKNVRRNRICKHGHRFESLEQPVAPLKKMSPSEAAHRRWNTPPPPLPKKSEKNIARTQFRHSQKEALQLLRQLQLKIRGWGRSVEVTRFDVADIRSALRGLRTAAHYEARRHVDGN